MGNCSLKASANYDDHEFPNNNNKKVIRVLTDSGTMLSFQSPKLAGEVITQEGYGIFKRGQASTPLDPRETLLTSHFYYLLPLVQNKDDEAPAAGGEEKTASGLASSGGVEVVRHNGRNGVWKVKLVIGTKELEDILADELNVEALVDRMRLAAAATPKPSPKQQPNRGKMKNRFNTVSSHC